MSVWELSCVACQIRELSSWVTNFLTFLWGNSWTLCHRLSKHISHSLCTWQFNACVQTGTPDCSINLHFRDEPKLFMQREHPTFLCITLHFCSCAFHIRISKTWQISSSQFVLNSGYCLFFRWRNGLNSLKGLGQLVPEADMVQNRLLLPFFVATEIISHWEGIHQTKSCLLRIYSLQALLVALQIIKDDRFAQHFLFVPHLLLCCSQKWLKPWFPETICLVCLWGRIQTKCLFSVNYDTGNGSHQALFK